MSSGSDRDGCQHEQCPFSATRIADCKYSPQHQQTPCWRRSVSFESASCMCDRRAGFVPGPPYEYFSVLQSTVSG
eukprot:scaffold99212_cov35-Prasinocladus_malaysianus.AAC.3